MTFESWLALREPADAAARSRELLRHLPASGRHVIHDLGCGTGAMGRWLAPLLPGPQHWILHDRDSNLLEVAATDVPSPAAVTVETRQADISRLQPGDLAGVTLITASGVLDMLTEDELTRLTSLCADTGRPTLLTLSVVGRVELDRPDALDCRVAAAFNAHQRRGRLLGPDAAAVAAEQFRELGCEVLVRSSPWRLGASETELTVEWFAGWLGAACEQAPELSEETGDYSRRRLAEAKAGQLAVTVGHEDILALPRSGR